MRFYHLDEILHDRVSSVLNSDLFSKILRKRTASCPNKPPYSNDSYIDFQVPQNLKWPMSCP